jgi:hypothetical protein
MPQRRDLGSQFKWPVSATRLIARSAEDLWAVISAPGNLEACHPFCAQNPVEVWPGPESRDSIHYLNGRVYERRFFRWLDGVGYDLEVGARGGRASVVSWRIVPAGGQASTLKITVHPHVLHRVPVQVRWLPHLAWVRPRLESYLSSVTRGFEWYALRGERVPRNQFGSHPWFSAPL